MPTQRTHTNLALRYAAASHVGKVWTNNEDAAYAGPSLLAVADGMGGHAAGEAANQAGGPDNVTAVVADVTGGPAPRSPVLVVGAATDGRETG
jgi:serine/threonine protein phosphatase PrpC